MISDLSLAAAVPNKSCESWRVRGSESGTHMCRKYTIDGIPCQDNSFFLVFLDTFENIGLFDSHLYVTYFSVCCL